MSIISPFTDLHELAKIIAYQRKGTKLRIAKGVDLSRNV
ncbi:hypothetical protein OP10G_2330 [Fimbriimonas ginsengisoli Gsoil 348]|uniref:Uncharacterized protein n=1 Tax=Fimbriimonas ginsengisoli Gsoil 348 TaxID=661478 RepID=A0A068NQ64_FIMGI|nr:hypothetical protein OP10G_2330 [Fimbriimonas ginsengisoli Gsoil 348]